MSTEKKNDAKQQSGQPDRQTAPVATNQPQENLIRYNYHEDNEGLINRQINLELYASYVYTAMAHHFDRYDVALKGHHKYFKKMAEEEHEHANKFMKYQNKRGGTIVLLDIKKPTQQSWSSPLEAHETALQLEKDVYQALLELHAFATKHNDPHLTNYLEEEFLDEQVKSIKKYGDYITNLRRVGPGLGEYVFDKEELQD
jgi:ferritin heavy chain